jgi:hypothetical protein
MSSPTTGIEGGAKALAKRPYLLRFGAGRWVTLLSSSSERLAPWQPNHRLSASTKREAQVNLTDDGILRRVFA